MDLSRVEGQVGVQFLGFGSALPKTVLTNGDLESMVDTTSEWIEKRTGIKERRIVNGTETTSDLGVKAAKDALRKSKINVRDIDLLIVATSTPDVGLAPTAGIIHAKLGLRKETYAFDVAVACSGFLTAVSVASTMIKANSNLKVLVVAADVFSKIVDWKDRSTCILFGDGAAAAVMGRCDPRHGILDIYLGADGTGWDKLYVPAGGALHPASEETVRKRQHFVSMNGKEIFRFVKKVVPESLNLLLERNNLGCDDIDYFLFHQANQKIIDSVVKKLGIDSKKVPANLDFLGNTSSASVPLLLDKLDTAGSLKEGTKIVISVFGAGLSWGTALIQVGP